MPPAFDAHDPLGLDASLDETERMMRDSVRRFVTDRVLPDVGRWFDDGHFPVELVKELGSLGLLGMHLDGYGCAGASATAYGLACQELEAGDSGFRSFVSVQGSLTMYAIHRFGSEAQKQEWLPPLATGEAIGCFGLTEADAGSDPANLRTRARKDGSDWVLDGTKMWITNGGLADVAVIWAQTAEPGDGSGIRGFLVPTSADGFTASPIGHKLSLRASVTSELVLDGVRVPSGAQLPGAEGLGGPLRCLNEARFGIVFGAVGAARACYESALDYATTREQFGRPIAGFQLQQAKLVDMLTRVQRSQLVALHIGRCKDAGTLRHEQVSLGKLHNVDDALAVARTARQVLGANGITLEYPVIRHMNNLESVVTYEGTADVHTLVLGRAITGHDAFT